jgi:mercuric ion binding protein
MALGAQNKFTETTLEVDGLCGMCEERIENAAYLPGVKKADWDRETHQLVLAFRNNKVSEEEIIASINEVGHDVKDHLATDEQYANIHRCCRYRDPEIRKQHGLDDPLCQPGESHEEHHAHGGKHNH